MFWWIIPTILLGFAVLGFVISTTFIQDRGIGFIAGISFLLSLFFWAICPAAYYESRDTVWQMEAYYDNIIIPSILAETSDTVVVSNFESAIWQSGSYTLATYNRQIKIYKLRQDTFWGHLTMYQLPESYKFVQIGK